MTQQSIVTAYYESPVGGLTIQADNICLRRLSFSELEAQDVYSENRIIENTIKQLDEYFRKERKVFQLPLGFHYNSMFQRLVWLALTEIPFGETRTYKEVARAINKPNCFRAVGNACGQNYYAIIVPCHRVVSSKGGIGGFSADIAIKKNLLLFESE